MATVRVGDFEWDDAKARVNLKKHGVAFADAVTIFLDPHAIDAPGADEANSIMYEPLFVLMGKAENRESSTRKAGVLQEIGAALNRASGLLDIAWGPPLGCTCPRIPCS